MNALTMNVYSNIDTTSFAPPTSIPNLNTPNQLNQGNQQGNGLIIPLTVNGPRRNYDSLNMNQSGARLNAMSGNAQVIPQIGGTQIPTPQYIRNPNGGEVSGRGGVGGINMPFGSVNPKGQDASLSALGPLSMNSRVQASNLLDTKDCHNKRPKSIICKICFKYFSKKYNLKRHLKEIHQIEAPKSILVPYKGNVVF